MKIRSTIFVILFLVQVYACTWSNNKGPGNNSVNITNEDTMKLKISIGTNEFSATLYNNATVTELKVRLPMSINMTELNGNEKYFDLKDSLPVNASNPGKIKAGDLMLYGANTLVLFYKTFTTSYNYTPLGQVDNPSGLATSLGSGNVTVRLEIQ